MKFLGPMVLLCWLLSLPALAEVAELGFMSGSWESRGGETVQETWSQPEGNELLGYSKTIQDGKLVFFEFLRIYQNSEGVFYQPYIRGKQGALFRLQQSEENYARFHNPDNDFPKTIEYRREGERLFIKLSGGGPPVNLTMQRPEP